MSIPQLDYSQSKVLIVDDNHGDLDVLIELLHEFDVQAVADGESAIEVVHEDPPHLILLDINMPELNGFEVCERLKADSKTSHIPIIFLSSRADVDNIVKGFDLGGVDYITKPYLPEETIARIKTHLRLCNAMSTLHTLANRDHLSGISNRRNFFSNAPKILEKHYNRNDSLHLFMIDIDNFKLVNDTYGHSIGDKIIVSFTTLVQEQIENICSFARLGGDEFVLILTHYTETEAREALEKLRAYIEKSPLDTESDIYVTISIGMTQYQKDDKDIDTLLLRADANLYKSKITKNSLH